MLPSDGPFLEPALALSALPFRPVTAGVLLPVSPPEGRRLRHARRTSDTSGKAGGLTFAGPSKGPDRKRKNQEQARHDFV